MFIEAQYITCRYTKAVERMSTNKKEVNIPTELPVTAKTQSPSCFLHSVILRAYTGEQAAYIYSCLSSQRKMSLVQLATKSGIKGANLKKILATLIQLGCVAYTQNPRTEQIFYHSSEEGCWKLTYVDEIVRNIRKKFGHTHASVTQNVILRGHLTVSSYVREIELKSEVDSIEQAFCDLLEDQWLVPVKDLDFKPLSSTFAECMHAANREFISNSAQYTRSDADGGIGGGGGGGNSRFKSVGMSQLKKNTIIKDLAKEKFLKLYYNDANKEKLYRLGNNSRDDSLDMAKGMSTLFSDDEDEEATAFKDNNGIKYLKRLNGSVPLTFSFERFLKYERDVQLVSMSKHRIGNVTAMIYKVVLNRLQKSSRPVRCIEDIVDKLVADASVGAGSAGSSTSGYDPSIGEDLCKRLELKDQEKGMNFGAADILKELSVSNKYELTKNDLIGTIDNEDDEEYEKNSKKRKALQDIENGSYKKSKLSEVASAFKTLEDEDEDEEEEVDFDNGFDSLNGADNNEMILLILQHLKLLTTDKTLSFLVETSPGHFYVPYSVLQSEIPLYQMKQIIRNIMGNGTLRVLNCIMEKRLIEEKNIAKSVLMREGDVRRIVATLTKFGLVEIQEIPRSADRNALRGVFAFKVNKNYIRSKRILGNCLMFNMGESLDSLENMKLENRILLDKISREDVRGREAELLLESELKQLKKIVDDERTGMAKFQRLRVLGEVLWFTETV